MARTFLDRDPLSGLTQYVHTGEGPGFVIESVQDVEPILEANKAKMNGPKPTGDFRHMATVPDIVQLQWFHKYGVAMWNRDHRGAVLRLLNSSEWSYLRTAPGKL